MVMNMHYWQLQEAKNKFSEVVRKAESEGPQMITRHGKTVAVVVTPEQFVETGVKPAKSMKDLLLAFPKLGPEYDDIFERSKDSGRDIDFD